MAELGIPILTDPNNGTGAGTMLIPNDINPENQTRSDARRSYYDPFSLRPNFHVMTGQFVTKLLIDSARTPFSERDDSSGISIKGVEVRFVLLRRAHELTFSVCRE
jgi:choline dehydrogenase-like flavoprotein